MDDIKGGAPPPEEPRAFPDDPFGPSPAEVLPPPALSSGGGGVTPPPPPPPEDEDDEEEGGMLRMSFMEHLEELRSRIIRALMGLAVAFVVSILYCYKLWEIISEPATSALEHLHAVPAKLVATSPMEGFSIIWVKLPLLCSVFLG